MHTRGKLRTRVTFVRDRFETSFNFRASIACVAFSKSITTDSTRILYPKRKLEDRDTFTAVCKPLKSARDGNDVTRYLERARERDGQRDGDGGGNR